jgi:chromosome segregation protein
MRLQRLEISGFKSFSDRSELSFDQGVTAIVGPNGCGKSNVADAIVWVLGEQSAKSLRGDRMEDVIFSGTQARKPTATADVRLMLAGVAGRQRTRQPGDGDDEDDGAGAAAVVTQLDLGEEMAREVEVTRRLYRSGESEYMINGEACRLRDVHDLLADTGLGAKAYAIIEQGKIGQILNSRATDRRQLIEEAAGITKYKARRRAAELKLDAAQQNLTRIEDIVFELEKQRGALKRQAAKARRYKRLRDDLRYWEKILFADRYRTLGATLTSIRERLAHAREEETVAAARLAGIENELSRLRLSLGDAEAHAADAREAVHGREMEVERRRNQVAFNRQQVDAMGVRAAEIAGEIADLEARREPARLAVEERAESARRADASREDAAAALAAENEAYQAAYQRLDGFEADVDAARNQVFAAINAATTLRHAIDNAIAARERVLASLARLEAESADLEVELGKARSDRAAVSTSLARAREQLEATRALRHARESDLATARIEHEWRTREMRSREQDLAGLVARLTSLEELDAGRAGYGDAARLVLAGASAEIAHVGSIADYLEVEGEYERAVEAWLGDLLQHVIVGSHAQAAAGLDFVRRESAGRCSFLVLDAVPASTPVRSVAEQLSALVPVESVVKVNGPYAAAIGAAMGRAWIARSFEQAAKAARVTGEMIVTASGDVFREGCLVAGGDRAEARGILATKREIKELRDRIEIGRAAITGLGGEIAGLDATIAETFAAVDELNATFHEQEKTILGCDLQVARGGEEIDRLLRKGELLANERRAADEERLALEARQVEARESIARVEISQRETEESLSEAQRTLQAAREAAEQLSQRAAESRATYAALKERAAGLAVEVARLAEAAGELESRYAGRVAEIEQTRRRRIDVEASTADLERLLDQDGLALGELRDQLRVADEGLVGLRAEGEAFEGRIRESRRSLEEIRHSVSEMDVARATAESDLSHLATLTVETLQATLDDVVAEVDQMGVEGRLDRAPVAGSAGDEADADEEVREEGVEAAEVVAEGATSEPAVAPAQDLGPEEAIAALRAKIDRLGPVNMMAIEQFDELEERHLFLTVQRKDLVDSIAATGDAIKRIDMTSKERFREAFVAINTNFQEVFAILFGGGQAGLTLLDEDDVLESGIEIIAQPPGKRLQNVQLLSGGEKALTAIALMFGIFKFKPSPFCLLDEIDAPLDDANIGRFVEMLRSMQENTQFILITHNRKTMEIADRLYGVTMEEPGVSKLISVRLH